MTPKIHATAHVDCRAELAGDVEVGPGAVVDGGVVLGAGCVVQAHAVLSGDVRCGERNVIGYGAVIGSPPQDLGWTPAVRSRVEIGSGNTIREYATIHRGAKEGGATVVGNDNFLMCGTHLGHDVKLGNRVIIANNCLLAGHVEVGDGAFLGGGGVFHQFMRIGRLALTQGLSGFGKDIPPFTIGANINSIVALNVIGLRRAGLSAEQRGGIKRVFDHFFRSGFNIAQALEAAEAMTDWTAEAREFIDFIESAKKRGLCRYRRVGEGGIKGTE